MILQILYLMIKMRKNRGDETDVSATTQTVILHLETLCLQEQLRSYYASNGLKTYPVLHKLKLQHRLRHPEKSLFLSLKMLFTGPQYPINVSSNLENKITALHLRLRRRLVTPFETLWWTVLLCSQFIENIFRILQSIFFSF